MRRITCRFQDGTTFLDSLQSRAFARRDGPPLQFTAQQILALDEVVRVAIIIEGSGDRHELHMRIDERTPAFDADDVHWHYRAQVTPGDAPWLKMLIEKFDTARRLDCAAS